MLNQQQKVFEKILLKRLIKDQPISKIVFQSFIHKISQKIPYFKNLDQLCDGVQLLALKARNIKENRDVSLKLVDHTYGQLMKNKNNTYAMKKEYGLLKKLSYNQYLAIVFGCFYLIDNDTQEELEEIGQDNQNEENQECLLLVLEMETFMRKIKI